MSIASSSAADDVVARGNGTLNYQGIVASHVVRCTPILRSPSQGRRLITVASLLGEVSARCGATATRPRPPKNRSSSHYGGGILHITHPHAHTRSAESSHWSFLHLRRRRRRRWTDGQTHGPRARTRGELGPGQRLAAAPLGGGGGGESVHGAATRVIHGTNERCTGRGKWWWW